MENNYLLTYDSEKNGITFQTYQWFETEEELKDYVKEWNIKVIEAIEIKDSKEIEF